PGSGKTTTLLSLIPVLKEKYKRNVLVMEADIDSDVDQRAISYSGTNAVQLHTGGMCNLDAEMSRQGLISLTENGDYDELSGSIIFLENVGTLVCPAEFDTCAHLDLVILSVPEGDDKPLKYPLVFEQTDAVLINKIDSQSAFDFSRERVINNIKKRNEKEPVFFISAKTKEGIDEVAEFISKEASKVIG
ncbi:MAG: hydrogenase nickel incorporation protein HypB, partial [Lachnospiraceae bacterium]|nr:hydrogenase nickel incorporation protein HypB [Lachnospiraceae bacterium]